VAYLVEGLRYLNSLCSSMHIGNW